MIDSIQNKWHQQLKEHGYFICFIDNNHRNYEKSNIKKASYDEMIRNFWVNRYDWDYFLSLIQKEYLRKYPEYFGISKKISNVTIDNQVKIKSIVSDEKRKSKSILNGAYYIESTSLLESSDNISLTKQSLTSNHDSQISYYKQTEMLLIESLSKSINFLGNDHFDTVNISIKLANLYLNNKKYEKAEKLYKEILKLIKLKFDNNHPDLLLIKNNLLIIFHQQGKLLKATALNLIMKQSI